MSCHASDGLLGVRVGTVTRYVWVAARKRRGVPDDCGVRCRRREPPGVLRLAGPSAVERAEAELVAEMRQIHADSGGAYGSARVTAELRRRGRCVNHKRVCRLMRHHGICGIHKRRRTRLEA